VQLVGTPNTSCLIPNPLECSGEVFGTAQYITLHGALGNCSTGH